MLGYKFVLKERRLHKAMPFTKHHKMTNLYIAITENDLNEGIIQELKSYNIEFPNEQIYVINAPLGDKKYNYAYKDNCVVILSTKHKLLFIDLLNNSEDFDIFYEDFLEDLSSISDKFNYKHHIGRPRDWKKANTAKIYNDDYISLKDSLDETRLNTPKEQRISELLISLLIGSINDIEKKGADVPETILEKIRNNIMLFDGEQTHFIYKEFDTKSVSIQGLSGTGKTELLLHKLKELYMMDDTSKIFFTCHNIALANTLKDRVPGFFNFMRVEKQIEWQKRLWVSHAWGSGSNPNSGLYSYLCDFYNAQFLRFNYNIDYEYIFGKLLEHINSFKDEEFNYAFDYILIDERQDFPSILFELCKKITRNKIYIAGDIFQDIFENANGPEAEVDIVLNKCYRTDPRTLMFAHGIGLGLFESKKLNWFPDSYWNSMGYKIERPDGPELGDIRFYREPIRRFENLQTSTFESVILGKSNRIIEVIGIIKKLIEDHKDISPDDIAIIILESNRKEIFEYIDNLSTTINREVGWEVNRAYENKMKIPNSVFISNPNPLRY